MSCLKKLSDKKKYKYKKLRFRRRSFLLQVSFFNYFLMMHGVTDQDKPQG